MINFPILRKAFNFYLLADTQYQAKSAFIDKLAEEVLFNKRNYYALDKIDTLRSHLARNQSKIQHHDFGAGSKFKTKEKTVASFVKNSASDNYKGQVLFQLARHFKSRNILELGTNLGIGTAYLASANTTSNVKSLEGCPNLSLAASKILRKAGINNAEVVTGKFSETLLATCRELKRIDLVFIDGDHSYKSTLKNYHKIKPFLHNRSIVVFDDIYWSNGMIKAWNEIKAESESCLAIDVFRLGIIFLDNEIQKGDFKLVSSRFKPWKIRRTAGFAS